MVERLSVGVYTVALNEEQFVDRWVASARAADHLLIADTGSTDDTVGRTAAHNNVQIAHLRVRPWRFDDARNAALALMPSELDIVVALDLDEMLTEGWREKIEALWNDTCTRLRYLYVWSWTATKSADVVFYADKIAGRHTHRWRHPIHEVLSPTVPEFFQTCDSVLIEHHPDSRKSRGQYLDLLRLAVREDPMDDRCSHYLGREYFFHHLYDAAIVELHRHLSLPRATWTAERAASMRYIAKCHEAKQELNEAHEWFTRATLEDVSRETLTDAARFNLSRNDFHATIAYCQRALQLPSTPGSYLSERYALAEGPLDLASVAHFHLGNRITAIEYAKKALELNPHDSRLKSNLTMMNG